MCYDDAYGCCMSPYAFANFYTRNKSNKKIKLLQTKNILLLMPIAITTWVIDN